MRTKDEAVQIVQELISNPLREPPLAIYDCAEFDLGWVFTIQTASYCAGNLSDGLEGNQPIFVPSDGGEAQTISYFRPVQEHLDAYADSGDANAKRQAAVRIMPFANGAPIDVAFELLSEHVSLSAGITKQRLKNCLQGKSAIFETSKIEAAESLVLQLRELGFDCCIPFLPKNKDPFCD